VTLPEALKRAREAILGGASVPEVLDDARASLRSGGFSRIDYFALVNAATLEPLKEAKGDMRLIAAALIGTTRLIDNIAV
jgi:pantoate--beta-alanine ligase